MTAEIASLSFSIDSSPIAAASSALQQMQQAAQGGQTKVGQLTSATNALIAALDRNTAAADALRAKLESTQLAAAKTSVSVQAVGQAANDATPKVDRLGTSAERLRPSFDTAAASAQKLRTAWADLSSQGAATLQNMERMAKLAESSANKPNPGWARLGPMGAAQSYAVTPVGRLSNLSSDGGVYGAAPQGAPAANQNRPGGGRLDASQFQNLFYQGSDIVASAASGMSPFTIALQQGGQIAPTFMGPNGASIGGVLGQAGDAVTGLLSRVTPMAALFGVAAAAIAATTVALSSYTSQQKELQLSVAGRGRASGATVGDINSVAAGNAGAAGVSVSNARDLVAEYADTGRIGVAMYGDLLKAAQDYAVTTRQELPDANKALAAAFADPAKGAETLNAQLGFLDATMQENIQRLSASGDRLGAQKLLMEGLSTSTLKASDRLGFFAKQWQEFKNNTSNEFDAIGGFVDRGLGGGDAETRLKALQGQLDFRTRNRGAVGGFFDSFLGFDEGQIRADIAKVQAEIDKAAKASNTSAQAQRSLEVNRIVQGANPAGEQLKQLDNQAANIRQYFAQNWLDPSGEAGNAMRELERRAANIRSDLAQGGSEMAASLRRAQFDASQVGRSQTSVSAATIDNDVAERIRNYSGDASKYNEFLQSMEVERVTRQQTLQRQSVLESGSGSNSYRIGLSQVPEQYRDQVYKSAVNQGLSPDFLASVLRQESGNFDPKVIDGRRLSPAGAEGIAQFMPATRRGMGDFNPFNPDEAIPKSAELLAQLKRQFNGNEAAALAGYNAGPGAAKRFVNSGFDPSVLPLETQKYIPAILQPGPNATARVTESVERNRQLDLENDKLKVNAQFLGENGLKLDAELRYRDLLSQAMARGETITDSYKQQLMATAEATASATRGLTNLKAAADLRFDGAQMGRDRYDQQAYSSARSLYGDTSTSEAQNYIGQKREQLQLQDVRSTITDAGTSFVQALSKGTSAASAFAQVLSRIGDKLISNGIDSIVGKAFGGATGGGGSGGFGGFLSSLFGGGSSTPVGDLSESALGNSAVWAFANGGVMTSRGPVQLRRYAKGGIANEPQLAMYGEAGPEAYVPLADGRSIPVTMSVPANGNAPGGPGGNTFAPTFMVDAKGATMSRQEYIDLSTTVVSTALNEWRRTQYSRGIVDKKTFG